MKKRGQFSLEYMLTLSVVIIIVIFSVVMYMNFSKPAEEQVLFAEGKKSIEVITQAAFDVYALSEGTQNHVTVRMPGRVKELRFVDKEAYLTIEVADQKTTEIVVPSKVNFFDKTFIEPAEGRTEFLVATKADGDELRVCIVYAEDELDC